MINIIRSIFQIFWKPHSCPDFLFLKLGTSDLHHRPCFSNLNSDWTCTVVKWTIITDLWQLYYYCRSQKLCLKNTFFTICIFTKTWPALERYYAQVQRWRKFWCNLFYINQDKKPQHSLLIKGGDMILPPPSSS